MKKKVLVPAKRLKKPFFSIRLAQLACVALAGVCFFYALYPQKKSKISDQTNQSNGLEQIAVPLNFSENNAAAESGVASKSLNNKSPGERQGQNPSQVGTGTAGAQDLTLATNLDKQAVKAMVDQVEAQAQAPQWHNQVVKSGDTLSKVLKNAGMAPEDIQQILKTKEAKLVKNLRPGLEYNFFTNQKKETTELLIDTQPGKYLHLALDPKKNTITKKTKNKKNNPIIKYKIQNKEHPLEKKLVVKTTKVNDSIISSARKSGLDKQIVNQMMDLLSWDQADTLKAKKHDSMKVLYEEKYHKGQKVETGNILALEIKSPSKKVQWVRYTDKKGNSGFFTPEGLGLEKPFLRNPVQASKISSRYGNRYHPIFHKMKHHTGVDFSAPYGSPIKAAGDAKVIFMGYKSGYGKVVELQHGPKYTTVYAHMSNFAKGLRVGSNVTQGQVIGYVGSSGSTTGPHVHYEFRVNGMHRDPLTIALPKTKALDAKSKKDFVYHARHMLRLME
ncbi:MAG: peptidoglycan DD-metalloendopeptidase family protein [Gammaproteobacteria bacterium]